jgi:hypothetical protein
MSRLRQGAEPFLRARIRGSVVRSSRFACALADTLVGAVVGSVFLVAQ